MATPGPTAAGTSTIFCHACSRQFPWRNAGGELFCPACHSDFVEILDSSSGGGAGGNAGRRAGPENLAEQSAEQFLGTLRTVLEGLGGGAVPLQVHTMTGVPGVGCAAR